MFVCKTYTEEERSILREGGVILQQCLEDISAAVKSGVTTQSLDAQAETFIRSHGASPSFKDYQGFPATLCTSINEECVHGIPGERILQEGEILSIDCGVFYKGLHTDACVTVPVGAISEEAAHLIKVTKGALKVAISIVKANIHVGDISSVVQAYAEERGCVPVRSLTGHGIGYQLHEYPDIPNFGTAGTGPILSEGCVIAIEPILALKDWNVIQQNDGWTLSMRDGGNSAHFEHTIFLSENGYEIMA